MTNLETFRDTLAVILGELFASDPAYQYAVRQGVKPDLLALNLATGLNNGTASKDGEGVRHTCKALGIPHTYKGIRAYFATPTTPKGE